MSRLDDLVAMENGAVPQRSATALVAATGASAIVGVAVVNGWEWLRTGEREGLCIVLAIVLAALALLPWAIGHLRRPFDMLEPTVVVGFIVMLAYVLPAFGMLAGTDVSWARGGESRASRPMLQLLAPALALVIAGVGSFQLAYYGTGAFESRARGTSAPSNAGRLHAGREVDARRLRRWTLLLAALAAPALLAFMIIVGGPAELLNRLNDRVRLFAGLNYLLVPITSLLALALVHYCRDLAETGRVRWSVWAASAAALAVNLLQGSKTNVLGIAFAFLAGHHYFRRRVSTFAALVAAVVAVVAAMVYDLYFREYLVIREVVSIDLTLSPFEVARLGWAAFASNAFVQLPVLMLMLDGIPNIIPFQLGRPYVALLLMPIPRAIFPGKPPVGTEIFSNAFFPDLLVDGTSMPTSMLGEFYFNFGPLGVIIGAAIAGWVARRAYRLVSHGHLSLWNVAVYGAFVAMLFPWIRGDTFGPTVFFVQLVGPVLLLRRLTAPGGPA